MAPAAEHAALREAVRSLRARRGEGMDLGEPLHLSETTGSTNDDAKRAAKDGAPHGSVWIADAQTNGRGRQGRAWVAAPGEALLMSVLFRVHCAPSRLPPIAIAAGLATHHAVTTVLGRGLQAAARVRLKWPNDVVVLAMEDDAANRTIGEGASPAPEPWQKLAGVLVESSGGSQSSAVIVGIGINVHTRTFPPELATRATSLARLMNEGVMNEGVMNEGNHRPSRAALLAELLEELAHRVPRVAAHGLGPFAADLTRADALQGRFVRTEGGGSASDEGVADGIDADGCLRVRRTNGSLARWVSGEVHLSAALSANTARIRQG